MSQLARDVAEVARLAAGAAGTLNGALARGRLQVSILRQCAADLRKAAAGASAVADAVSKRSKG